MVVVLLVVVKVKLVVKVVKVRAAFADVRM